MSTHYFQACTYQTSHTSPGLPGIAKLPVFGLYDVEFILDMNGQKIPYKDMYQYELSEPSYERSVTLLFND